MASPMAQKTVLKLLHILMSPSSPGAQQDHTKNQTTDDRERFDVSLQATLDTFKEELSKIYTASPAVQENDQDFQDIPDSFNDVRWHFVLHCLKLMQLLKSSIERSLVEFRQSQKEENTKTYGPMDAPPLSPDTLSFGQQKNILTALQFITCLGIVPNLDAGVGIPLENRSGFESILSGSSKASRGKRHVRLLKIVKVLLECIEQPSLGGLILSRHIGDLLAILVQLLHSPRVKRDVSEIVVSENGLVNTTSRGENATPSGDVQSAAYVACLQQTPTECAGTSKCSDNKGDVSMVTKHALVDDGHCTEHEERYCKDQLESLLIKTYQPGVIKELLLLQGGPGVTDAKKTTKGTKSCMNPLPRAPRWLTKVCGELLCERFMQPNGVQNLLKAVLDGSGGQGGAGHESSNWEKCEAVAKLITNCPLQSHTMDSYYSMICPQVLKLLHVKDKVTLQQVLRVACTCIDIMVEKQPLMADKYFIEPLIKPLLDTTGNTEINHTDKPEGSVIPVISEFILGKCIDCMYRVYVVGTKPNSSVIPTMSRVIDPLFKLYCFARKGVCNLRAATEKLLLNFFKQCDANVSVQYLKHVTFVDKDPIKTAMHSHITFVPGSQGGAIAVFRVAVSLEELFSESLMGQDNVADAVLILLQQLKRETLSGDYFILLLQELTSILTKPPEASMKTHLAESTASSQSKQFVDVENQHFNQILHLQHCLQILAILSKIGESLGPDLLGNTRHILCFVKATLERACQSLGDRCDGESNAFETETLTMGFGLLSAIMNGEGEKKVTSENKQVLMDLIPLLEQISSQHQFQPIRSIASELRITVTTHGAVWSENMKDTIQQLKAKTHQTRLQESKQTRSTSKDTNDDQRQDVNVDLDDVVTSKKFDEAFEELFDPLLPVRGHALLALAKLLQAHDPKAMQKSDSLLMIFEENVSHSDSYIYLAAIKGLVGLVEVFPEKVVPKLCAEYIGLQSHRDEERNIKTRLKLGEALVKATRCLGELVPNYSQQLLGALLVGTRDPDGCVRASSLSNIADVCQLLKFSLGLIVHEIMNCVTSLLKTDPEVEVRRACMLVITLILKGLGTDALKVLDSVMLDLYRQLKLAVAVEKDGPLLLHAQLALEELDIIMKEYLFPKETLSKKITVLPDL